MSYDEAFYSRRRALSRASAEVVLGDLIAALKPKSMIDIGCGTGSWLAVAKERGVDRVVGIDGGTVPAHLLEIAADAFVTQDLNLPLQVNGKFDLAMCLEVAEHLGAERAEGLVAELAERSDCVLFGAAIPQQIGTNHINCRWQSYWKGLFQAQGYVRLSYVQERFWHDRRVNVVYRQNAGLYLKKSRFDTARLEALSIPLGSQGGLVDVVHPELYLLYLNQLKGQFTG
jgi:SAM-dependent methyltransferase